jgi:hypothetical protein
MANTASSMSPWLHAARRSVHHHCLPVRLSVGGCSFQFGRTSMWRPRAPHLAHTTLLANQGTSTSSANFGTSIKPWWRHASLRQDASSRCTPRWRIVPSVIGEPGACFCFVIAGRGQLRSFFNRNRIAVLAVYTNLYVARRFAIAFVRIEHTDRNN